MMFVISPFSTMMSTGPRAGAPLPSTIVALWMTRRPGFCPWTTPRVWAARFFGAETAAIAAAITMILEKTIFRLLL